MLPRHTTLLQFYDHPRTGNTITGIHGELNRGEQPPPGLFIHSYGEGCCPLQIMVWQWCTGRPILTQTMLNWLSKTPYSRSQRKVEADPNIYLGAGQKEEWRSRLGYKNGTSGIKSIPTTWTPNCSDYKRELDMMMNWTSTFYTSLN